MADEKKVKLTSESLESILEHHNPQIQESIKTGNQFYYIDTLCDGLKIPEYFEDVCDYTMDKFSYYRKEHGKYMSQINALQDGTIEAYEIELNNRYNNGELNT